ncbi:thioredoxin [Paramecium bursaria Chlorella virus AP110A]|nr:thioredoxin [Paramecium bursaria Chlorella virus AP110A]
MRILSVPNYPSMVLSVRFGTKKSLLFFSNKTSLRSAAFRENLKKHQEINMDVLEIDCDENPEISDLFGVKYIPTAILLDNGFPVSRMDGSCKSHEFVDFLFDVVSLGKDPLM